MRTVQKRNPATTSNRFARTGRITRLGSIPSLSRSDRFQSLAVRPAETTLHGQPMKKASVPPTPTHSQTSSKQPVEYQYSAPTIPMVLSAAGLIPRFQSPA